MMKKLTALAILALTVSFGASAKEVYSWQTGSSTAYSDTPRNLQLGSSGALNIRTHTVKPIEGSVKLPDSIAELQAHLNKRITEENKKVEEQNAKNKAENCQVAKDNRERAATAERNKDQLMARFDADIQKYCN